MNRWRRGDRRRAGELDRALDAYFRGDESEMEGLPEDLVATISRLGWLVSETARAGEAPRVMREASQTSKHRRRHSRPSTVALETGQHRRSPEVAAPLPPDPRPARRRIPVPRIMSVVTMLLLIGVIAVSTYGIIAWTGDEDASESLGMAPPEYLDNELLFMRPETCTATPVGREEVMDILRDVDVDRDEALRRASPWVRVSLDDVPIEDLNGRFLIWQSCRRFGYTYEAKRIESPYFIREDFYGERSLAFHGPIERAYSDRTLQELLDRREQADATSREYWAQAGDVPYGIETLVLGGEVIASEDGQFIGLQAGTLNHDATQWTPNGTIVVFQQRDGVWRLFDIQIREQDGRPWIWYRN